MEQDEISQEVTIQDELVVQALRKPKLTYQTRKEILQRPLRLFLDM